MSLDVAFAAFAASWSYPLDFDATPYVGIRCRVRESLGVGAVEPATSERHAARCLRRALEHVVADAVGSAKRFAVLTGGGLDSGALLALSVDYARRAGKQVFAIALDFAASGDDRPFLVALEKHHGCEVVRVRPREGAAYVDLLSGVDGAPLQAPTALMDIAAVAKAKAQGAEVVLSGAGGDQLFDGRPGALANFIRRGHVTLAVRRARKLRGFVEPRSRLLSWLVRPIASSLVPARARAWRRRRLPLDVPDWAGPAIRAFAREERERRLELAGESLDWLERSGLEAARILIGWFCHQVGHAGGVPLRDPFTNSSLVDLVRAWPQEWLLAGGERRGLFRVALEDLLPATLRHRQSKSRFEPALQEMIEPLGGLGAFRSLARVEKSAELGLVNAFAFTSAFASFVREPSNGYAWRLLWPVLAVEAFLQAVH